MFLETTETIYIKNLKVTSNMVYVKEIFWNFSGILYTVEMAMKSAIQW